MLLWVLFGTALVVGTLALSRTLLDKRRARTGGASLRDSRSLEILEARYAQGEIDIQELEERRCALGSHAADRD